ncbi:hypothetical protein WG66_000516 [Moniliophthora roreri]|uniref:Uncharacterized protein n=1 Tax=Moniliophthora roreri TaxID=221103 RepID=A0A0W0FVQ6_MONRR|nr:hypothetical protein WG66_000516 [Moniliophthora roreri]
MAPLPLDKAYLTAIWLETLFYGINLSLFFSYLFIVKFKRRTPTVKPVIFIIAVFMFIFSTIHVSMGFSRLIIGFIELRDQPGGPGAFFSDVSIPANVAKVTIHTVNSILGDSILVWRCYHVWGESLMASVGPALLIVASAVCGFGQAVIFARAKATHSAFADDLPKWNGSLFSLSLATNVLVTSLIAFRIWWIGRQIDTAHTKSSIKYRRVLILIIESGAIYSSALIIEITLYFIGSNAFYIVYDPIAQLTAIVPTMIIIMTSLGMTSSDFNSQQTRAGSSGKGTISVESRPNFAVGRETVSTGPFGINSTGDSYMELGRTKA